MKPRFLVLLSLLLFAATASGQDIVVRQEGGPGGNMRFQMPSFADLDKNKDKKISRDEFQGPAQFFDRLDENHDGFIDEEEFSRIRRGGGMGRLPEQLSKFLDSDGDGKVSREEFSRLSELFEILDKDNNSELTQEELGRFFQAVGEAQNRATGGVEVNNLFDKADKNKDGRITADEMGNERTFKALDLNQDGTVTKEEAAKALKQLAERARQQKNP